MPTRLGALPGEDKDGDPQSLLVLARPRLDLQDLLALIGAASGAHVVGLLE